MTNLEQIEQEMEAELKAIAEVNRKRLAARRNAQRAETKRLLNNPMPERKTIYNFIVNNPGMTTEQLAEKFEVTRGRMNSMLHSMILSDLEAEATYNIFNHREKNTFSWVADLNSKPENN